MNECTKIEGDKRVCYAVYHLVVDVIPKLKKISQHDKNIIRGMIPPGKYSIFLWPLIAQVEYTYLKDEVGHMKNIGKCPELGYVDHLYGAGAWWYSTYRFHITYEKGDWDIIWKAVCTPIKKWSKDFKKEFMGWYKRLAEHMLWSTVAATLTDIGELVALAVLIAVIEGVEEWLENLGLPGWLLNPLLNLLGFAKNSTQNLETEIENNLNTIGQAIAQNNKLLEWMIHNGLESLYEGINNITSNVENIVGKELQKITPVVEHIKEWVSKEYNKVITTVNNTVDKDIDILAKYTGVKIDNINKQLDDLIGGQIRMELGDLLR